MFGIYNNMSHEFQFGICVPTKQEAYQELKRKIGYNALKWRFTEKYIPESPSNVNPVCKHKCAKCVKVK
jgi:hypothetical protein